MARSFDTPRLQRGTEVVLTIETLGDRGKAIARMDGYVVMVRGAAPGDTVRVAIVRTRRSWAEGKVLKVLSHGPARVKPRCKYFGTCGGCSLQHVDYAAQLSAKADTVAYALGQAGVPAKAIRPTLAAPSQYYYRNKMEFSFSADRWLTPGEITSGRPVEKSFALGLHAPGSFFKVLDLDECHLQSDLSARIVCQVRDFVRRQGWSPWNIRQHVGYLRHLIIRQATNTADLLVNLVTSVYDPVRMDALATYLRKHLPEVTTLVNTINDTPGQTALGAVIHRVYGKGFLREKLGPFTFEVAPAAFFQTNTQQAAALCEVVQLLADPKPEELVLDLYCGTGAFALYLAMEARHVVGIELVEASVRAARRNASANGIKNCTFLAGDMLSVFSPAMLHAHGRPDTAIVDPPRAGMHPKVVRRLAAMGPERIVYVSCNPRTQARDLAVLLDRYQVVEVQPLDLFPQTHHAESVALLTLQ